MVLQLTAHLVTYSEELQLRSYDFCCLQVVYTLFGSLLPKWLHTGFAKSVYRSEQHEQKDHTGACSSPSVSRNLLL
jgi:hypothetical protein